MSKLDQTTTAKDIVFAATLPEGFDFNQVPFEGDTWEVTNSVGMRFVIGTGGDPEDPEWAGFTWTVYDDEDFPVETDGSDDAQDATAALARFTLA